MARYTDPKCRICRRAGVKLFLKGTRCFSPKCPIDRHGAVAPGPHKSYANKTGYGLQLAEKQKAKNIYGVLEKQFRKYFNKALKVKGATGETLIQILERRLDNTVFRLGFTHSRSVARQLVSHGHVMVNGKSTNVPSLQVSVGSVIALLPEGQNIPDVKASVEKADYVPPAWLERKVTVGKVVRLPNRDEAETGINEQLIVEYYSR